MASLASAIEEANAFATELGRRTRSLCWHFLAPVKDQMAPDTKDVNALADQLDARQGYWAALEEHFPTLLERLGDLADTEPETVAPVRAWWAQFCAVGARESLLTSQKRLGEGCRVVSAFHNVAAHKLQVVDMALDCDVLVFGEKAEDREVAIALAAAAGIRGLHAGPLANSAAAEALTSVIIGLNRTYKADGASIRMTGIPAAPKA